MWTEVSLGATHEAVDWVKTLLATIDPTIDLSVTQSADPDADWPLLVRFYLPQAVHSRSRTEDVAALLSPLCRTGLTSELQVISVAAIPPPL